MEKGREDLVTNDYSFNFQLLIFNFLGIFALKFRNTL